MNFSPMRYFKDAVEELLLSMTTDIFNDREKIVRLAEQNMTEDGLHAGDDVDEFDSYVQDIISEMINERMK